MSNFSVTPSLSPALKIDQEDPANLPKPPAGYGDFLLEIPESNEFSAQNLWLLRQFFTRSAEKPKLQPLVREISWAKNLVILARCKDDLERGFYLRATT